MPGILGESVVLTGFAQSNMTASAPPELSILPAIDIGPLVTARGDTRDVAAKLGAARLERRLFQDES